MKLKTQRVIVEGSGMAGECFRHDLRWFRGGTQCPVCALETELKQLRRVAEAARGLVEYRKQAGAINFQLEKADHFINLLRIETEPK